MIVHTNRDCSFIYIDNTGLHIQDFRDDFTEFNLSVLLYLLY